MASSEVVRVGMRTPWGTADSATIYADGIGSVGTPGHGGVKLSAARNRLVPAPLRRAGGWYEEDCDAYIPMHVFRAELKPRQSAAEVLAGMRRWYPEQVDAAYPPEPVSLVKAAKDSGRLEIHRVSPAVAVRDAVNERVIVPLAGTSSDPARRALDATDDGAVIDGPADDGDRCGACKGLGLVRGIGKHAGGRYRTLAGAQAAQEAGRAVDCPTCAGVGLVGLVTV